MPFYERIDMPATVADEEWAEGGHAREALMKELAGDAVTAMRTTAPGNDQPFGGIKVETASGWFAARPSGTEDVCKIYAESFRDADSLKENSGRGTRCHCKAGFIISESVI